MLVHALEYWHSKRNGRRMPSRRDIQPTEIPRILPHIVLNDVVPGTPVRYRYRLVGTRVTDYYGMDPTGRFFDDVATGTFYDAVVDAFEACRLSLRPRFDRLEGIWPTVHTYWRLMLPLSDDDVDANIIMVILVNNADRRLRNSMRKLFRE